jgi:hypothetical protein
VDEQRPSGGPTPGDEPIHGDDPVVSYEPASPAGSPPDGPPPPPFERERRRRRRVGLAIAAALLVIGIPIGLAIVSALAERDDQAASPAAEGEGEGDPDEADDLPLNGDGEEEADTDPDGAPDAGEEQADPDDGAGGGTSPEDGGSPDGTLTPPDVQGLDGLDATYAQLLVDIDASERAMIRFQEEVRDAFAAASTPADAAEVVEAVAGDARAELLEVRERLVDPLEDAGAEVVRSRYVEHLDSWADYMEAIEQEPLLLAEGGGTAFTLVINATADAFARALEAELPADIDGEVARFAEGILDRGFRSSAEAQV